MEGNVPGTFLEFKNKNKNHKMIRPSANGSATKRVRTTTTTKAKPNVSSRKIPRSLTQATKVVMGKGFPKQLEMTHRYCDTVRLLSASGATSFQKFAANGMYDPDLTGTGHQPYYYDQLTALYNHYVVTKSRITITFVPSSNIQAAMVFSLAENDDGTVGNLNVHQQIEITNAKYGVTGSYSNDKNPVLRHSYDARKVFGGDPLADEQLEGTVNSNPPEIYCWIVSLRAMDAATSVSMDMLVDIQYTAVWSELKEAPTS